LTIKNNFYQKFGFLPYYLVLSSIFLNVVGSFLNFSFHRVILLATIGILFIIIFFRVGHLFIIKSHFIIIGLLSLVTIVDLVKGYGLKYFSFSHFIVYTFIFFQIFMISNIKYDSIINMVFKIYKILIISIFIEAIIVIIGYQELLDSLFINVNSITSGYKSYHNRMAEYFGLSIGGLNSPIMGTQIASQLTVICMFLFAPIYQKTINHYNYLKNPMLLTILSLSLFIFSPTMTGNLMFIITLMIFIYIFPRNRLKNKINFVLVPLILLLLFPLIKKYGFGVLESGYMFQYYWTTFTSPLIIFFNLPINYILFGFPELLSLRSVTLFNEFGFARLFYVLGFVYVAILTATPFYLFITSLRIKYDSNEKELNSWIWIRQINLLIIIIFMISLFHYVVLFRLGVVQLIGFHYAVSTYAKIKINRLLKSENNNILIT